MAERLARIVRLERKQPPLPWHIPADFWTERQLETVLAPGVIENMTDAQLHHFVGGDDEPA